ncbi:MAG: acyltransferase [Beijerinckiaceae bacterium]|nr:acyltransferase [Beijerinckiaceae bacterium]
MLDQERGSARFGWVQAPSPNSSKSSAQASVAKGRVLGRFYYPELDALRFAAFVLVFLHHIAPRESSGYASNVPEALASALASAANMLGYGLPLFFFLSAFLITELLVREKLKTNAVRIADFYVRRGLRIWPLYFLGIVIGVAIAIAAKLYWPSGNYGDSRMLAMYLALIGNWYFATGIAAWPGNPMTPLWSISIEEQFYVFWPAVIRYTSERAIFGVCAVMMSASIAAEFYLGGIHSNADAVIWTNSFVQFEMFAGGALLALLLRGSRPRYCTVARLALAALSLSLWFASAYWFQAKCLGPALSGPSVVIGYLLIACGCATIMTSVLGITRSISPLLIYLGRISFGLYVFHLVAIDITGYIELSVCEVSGWYGFGHIWSVAASLLLTIVMAALSYRFFETPFLRLKERFSVIASRPI